MLRTRLVSAVLVPVIGVTVLAGAAHPQEIASAITVGEMPMPGGLRAALDAIGDHAAPDRSQFAFEFIRRTWDAPVGSRARPRDSMLERLIAHLDRAAREAGAGSVARDTLPLPLSTGFWTDVIFARRATPATLAASILGSRSASLLYYGLLSLDDDTRAWLAAQPDRISEIFTQHSARFAVVSPAFRVRNGKVRVPGGDAAEPVWEALVGQRVTDPVAFLRAVLAHGEGRLAYFMGSTAQWTQPQVAAALDLGSPVAARIDAARRLAGVFERLSPAWQIDERSFWRPTIDPALLVADLRTDDAGRPVVPGSRQFWTAAFGDVAQLRAGARAESAAPSLVDGEVADIAWLCDQIFRGEQFEQGRRYQIALFASRFLSPINAGNARDALDTIRAVVTHPSLIVSLERAGLRDVAVFASAVRRARQLSAIEDEERAIRALAQFQGAVALVTRAASRGSVTRSALPEVVASLAAVEVSDRGEYEGRLVQWLDELIVPRGAGARSPAGEGMVNPFANALGPMDSSALRMLAGPDPAKPRIVDWEGTRYQLDFVNAEARRLARIMGDQARPHLSAARALVDIADALVDAHLTRDAVHAQAALMERAGESVGWESGELSTGAGLTARLREMSMLLQRAASGGDLRAGPRLAPRVRSLGDEILARGLMELAYAVSLGQPDRAAITAADAASRHEFWRGVAGAGRGAAWRQPLAGADPSRNWHVTGSILGLDVRLAELALVPVSARLPPRRPTLNDEDRRVLTEAVVLIDPLSLTDEDRDTVVAAIRRGRAKVAAISTQAEARAAAESLALGPARRTLFVWTAAHERNRLETFLSPAELLWLGVEKRPVAASVQAWGAPAGPRLGCLCLQLLEGRPWETIAGRWNSGLLASLFPDLNLRLAELLAELKMPAALAASVVASATIDIINTAPSRDADDRRALAEVVDSVGVDQVEQYLSLLTTGGPLVPMPETVNQGRRGTRAESTGPRAGEQR